jgi:hypothetical protein
VARFRATRFSPNAFARVEIPPPAGRRTPGIDRAGNVIRGDITLHDQKLAPERVEFGPVFHQKRTLTPRR